MVRLNSFGFFGQCPANYTESQRPGRRELVDLPRKLCDATLHKVLRRAQDFEDCNLLFVQCSPCRYPLSYMQHNTREAWVGLPECGCFKLGGYLGCQAEAFCRGVADRAKARVGSFKNLAGKRPQYEASPGRSEWF